MVLISDRELLILPMLGIKELSFLSNRKELCVLSQDLFFLINKSKLAIFSTFDSDHPIAWPCFEHSTVLHGHPLAHI